MEFLLSYFERVDEFDAVKSHDGVVVGFVVIGSFWFGG
jgi:hypothetical protein